MATKYEYLESGDSNQRSVYGANYEMQSFTPQTTHTMTSFRFKLWREGVVQGNITVAIYAVDGDHKPTGSILCSGTQSPSDAETVSPGDFYDVDLGSGYEVQALTEYAAVISYPSGDATHYLRCRYDPTGTYTGGRLGYSINSGGSWTVVGDPGADYMFQDWGHVGYPHSIGIILD